uniref:Uncharacterized protein n=1 Tax=Physcomitrium patens TaxID=3218 RepID=A0A2K1KI12_PHYPA|nr:hypothetical protein PHYPA_007095 [Physcomitrium patens]
MYKNKEAKIKEYKELQKVQSKINMKKIKVEKILVEANEKMKDEFAFVAKMAVEMRAVA